jgi:transcriptional antiterminator NusG
METTLTKNWYTIKVHNGQEKKIQSYIEKLKTEYPDNIFRVVIPMEKTIVIRNGKGSKKDKNMFSGYIFIEAILTGEVAHAIKDIPSVLGFVGDKGKPQVLRPNEVENILRTIDEHAENSDGAKIPFLVNENVKITDGAFANFSGVINKILQEKGKVEVLVKIFGRSTPVELSYTQIVKEY